MASAGEISLSFTLTGNKKLDRMFAELPKRMQKKVLREGLRPAAKLVQTQAKANIPSKSGKGSASLKVRAGKRSRKYPDRVSINVITAAGWFRGETFYMAFDEFGFKLGSRKAYTMTRSDGTTYTAHKLGTRYVTQRKQVSAKRWLKNATNQRRAEATALAQRLIAQGVEREAASLANRTGS